MISSVFAVLAVAQLCLAVSAGRYWRAAPGLSAVVPTLVCSALVWDNGVIAVGSSVGAGPLLETLSVPRFVAHALLTPLLVLWSLSAAEHAGLRWARRRAVRGAAAGLTVLLVAAGVLHDVIGLTLRTERWADTLRYVNDAASPTGPLPAIITGLVVLSAGIVLWRSTGFAWLAVTAAVMVVVSGAAVQVPVLGNAGEVVLDIGLLLTVRRLLPGRASRSSAGTAPAESAP
ncbi:MULTISPECIES: hypothetical protein [Streptomyces]|uniref:Uncharacterized protein n=1 Tax=Streptomyces glycanivorans TaxID=3033808 RepID=A0ABY9J5E0_9ACTN|nr:MULTISPECIES: hypothetical protein [unclassified Streptomyces]WSQ76348.1 hypothetical protein OG725_04255 [Streptomyces sp. NBC_01213]TXS20337.1 hypothetical protein EAO68_00200 [Streptomyces sp. wa22]WLQ62835.1 hypothetical protein P8A20_04165 [Streptomyces sp. Alt3]WSQ83597.1 hypothetical protein OG722_04220 [Streptomyces sp. NBC_01212]WSR10375.1 hypothetical protein OG265_32105 [Streptomyces sp. NBC_01208]